MIWPRLPPWAPEGHAESFLGQLGKAFWLLQRLSQRRGSLLLGASGGLFVLRVGGKQDVGCLEQIRAAEPLPVVVVEAPAGRLVRFRRLDLARQQCPDQRLVPALALVRLAVVERVRLLDPTAAGRLQQQLADHKRARRRQLRLLDRARRVILELGVDGVIAELDAVDEHRQAQMPSLDRFACLRTI